jgi:glutamyl-Q tRNA(Asp) synthetase
MIVTRFAPSPTGLLHLGHAFSALCGWRRARAAGGKFLLRLEDIDSTRCKPEYAAAIAEDLVWLGLDWDGEIRVQSAQLPDYRAALGTLEARGLLYPCFCTRTEIAAAAAAPHGATPVYPGTCRALSHAARAKKIAAKNQFALRLDTQAALAEAKDLRFFEESEGWVTAEPARFGDIVLARKDTPTSYHLCVVHDDALQGVTHVTRGEDLRDATHVQILLQRLLGLPSPVYAHHRLLTDAAGRRLAKRDAAVTLRAMRDAGATPEDILARLRNDTAATHIGQESGVA